jgi:hypothetical protein
VGALVVTGRMIADLVILGFAIKIIVGAVSRGRQLGDVGGAFPGSTQISLRPRALPAARREV